MRVGAITDRRNCVATTTSREGSNVNECICIGFRGSDHIREGGDRIISERVCKDKPKHANESMYMKSSML